MSNMRLRLVVETGIAFVSFVVFLLTLLVRDWVEVVFRFDPDHRSGSVEWLIVGGLATLTLLASLLASREWRRTRLARASAP